MSQRKTNVPGIVSNDSSSSSVDSRNSVWRTEYSGSSRRNATHLPDVNAPRVAGQEQRSTGGVPVMGFLYSISRQGIGEYWPILAGRNTIGRDDSNDIVLAERTVSSFHAVLKVRKMKSTGKVIASIKDEGCKTGILVNGEELEYEDHECFDGDIITIGCNYTFLLILINAEEKGLSVSESFQDDIQEQANDVPPTPFPQERPTLSPYDRNNCGTVPMGGTPFMDETERTHFMNGD